MEQGRSDGWLVKLAADEFLMVSANIVERLPGSEAEELHEVVARWQEIAGQS